MKVIFQNGDIKNVSDGHARNFLFPRKLARPATGDIVKISEALKAKRAAQDIKSQADAEVIAAKLNGAVIEITEGANSEGHLYGSGDTKKIAAAIEKEFKIKILENQIDLPHGLKTTGEHQVKINLHLQI